MQKKQSIRKESLQIRNQMEDAEVLCLSHKICQNILSEEWYAFSSELFVYQYLKNEVNLTDLINKAWIDGKKIYFPKVCKEDMDFYQVNSFDELEAGAFGILEPKLSVCEKWNGDSNKHIILVPGVAFSKSGQRIGYGKGYYDRFFHRELFHECFYKVGINYDKLLVDDEWIREPFDVAMDVVITDKRKVKVKQWDI